MDTYHHYLAIELIPMSGRKEFHEGLDFAGKQGTPVVAVAAGIITWSGSRYGYGNMIEVSHGNGLYNQICPQ